VYNIWAMMRQRCTNPNAANYANYGARGITVCDRWRTFAAFYADMGDPPSPKHTLDRIDLAGHYTPQNCRWADVETQQNNRSNGVRITAFGLTLSPPQWARRTGLSIDMIRHRVFTMGMPPEQALVAPRMSHNKRRVRRYLPDGSGEQFFDSLADAAKATAPDNHELARKAIWRVLAGNGRVSYGYCWEYVEPETSESTTTDPETSSISPSTGTIPL
jgi:hypothetical protein